MAAPDALGALGIDDVAPAVAALMGNAPPAGSNEAVLGIG